MQGQTRETGTVERIHHVEIYVCNLHQSAYFYRTVLGFRVVGHWRDAMSDRASIALERGEARIVLTAPLQQSSEVNEHLRRHGEGVKNVALTVRGIDRVFERALDAGARGMGEPAVAHIGDAEARVATISACGTLVHSLIEPTSADSGWPSADATAAIGDAAETALGALDHVAIAVASGTLDRTVEFYRAALGLIEIHEESVGTEYTAMRSKVVGTPEGSLRFPLLEPAPGKRRSQIDVFLEANDGPGVQHLAFQSSDIVTSVSTMASGVAFLPTPQPYYESIESRIGSLPPRFDTLSRHGILIDRDATGCLLQVFTKPIGTRPTLFLEIIERRGATGFGSGNIKALFEAVERLQLATT